MSFNRSVVGLLLAALMVMSVFAMPAAADVTADGDISDGSQVDGFNAETGENRTINYETTTTSDASNASEAADDFEELSLHVEDSDGITHAEYSADDVDVTDSGTDDTDAITVQWTVEHDDLVTLPGQPGANTTATMNISENSTSETDNATADVDYNFNDTRNVMYLANGASDYDAVDVTEMDASIFNSLSFGILGSDDPADQFEISDERTIAGDNTSITMHLASSNISSDYADVAGEPDGGALLFDVASATDNTPVPVFYDEAGDLVDEDTDEYGVYDSSADTLTLELGDDYEGETSVETLALNADHTSLADIGWGDMTAEFGYLQGTQMAWGLSLGSLSIGALIVFGSIKRRED